MNRAIINLVYLPQTDPPHLKYSNDKGEIWHSNRYDPKRINIGMSWFSIRDPKPQDSILVIEPYCVLQRDYDPHFARQFQYIFTWANKAYENTEVSHKVIELNHPTYHNLPNPESYDHNLPSWGARRDEIAIIANNKASQHHSELYSYRLILADMLHNAGLKVSWRGQIPIRRDYYGGTLENKDPYLRQVKFCLCTENSYDPVYTYNYLTEKMPDAWMAGTVPIYFGCHNIDNFGLPKNSYIDLREYSTKSGSNWNINKNELIETLRNYSEQNYNDHRAAVKEHIFKSGKLTELCSYSRAYDKIIDVFYNDLNK